MTNYPTTILPMVMRLFTCFVGALLLMVLMMSSIAAQTVTSYSPTNGATPVGLAPGKPAGSYALSDFDNLNPYNGSLNFNLPLLQMGGRGAAGYTMMLPIDRKWRINKTVTDTRKGCEPCEEYFVTYQLAAIADWWHPEIEDFGPGMMSGRYSGDNLISGCFADTQHWQKTLTRLTFTAADGTEYEFRDQDSGGQPLAVASCTQGPSRGRVFVTADGSAATFISDTVIYDAILPMPADSYFTVSGYLLMRDGTRYRIDEGKVSWIRDRNGNMVRFTSDHKIIDSLNREVSVTYGGSGWTTYRQINFKGYNGAQRAIRIQYDSLANALRPASGQHPAETIKTFGALFPGITDWGKPPTSAGGDFNTRVISWVELPDGRRYRFFYNSYGELARVELPTGGAFEYDWTGGVTDMGGDVFTGPNYEVVRQVGEKRVYREGGVLESRMVIDTCSDTMPLTQTCRQVDQIAPNGSLLGRTKHFYYGNPLVTLFKEEIHYPKWDEGKEYKTEAIAADGTTVLQRTETNWAQRAQVAWWPSLQLGPEPSNDPRVTSVKTTLTDVSPNLVSLKTFGYDDSLPHNNQSDVREYDFGQGTNGPLLRHTHTDYVTSATYAGTDGLAVYAGTAAHLRSLPLQQWVSSDEAGNTKLSLTAYEYDNYTLDNTHNLLTPRTDISGLCTTFQLSQGVAQCSNLSPNTYYTRGNLTGVTSYLNPANQTSPVTVAMQYDVAGNMVRFLDARSIAAQQYYATTINYTDCFGSTPDAEARINSAPTELAAQSQSSYAFATSVTNSLGQIAYSQYSYYLGTAIDAEDINGVVASGSYNDALGRPTQVILANNLTPLRRQQTFSYDDNNRTITMTGDLRSFNDNLLKSQTLYDGLGRITESRSYENATDYIATRQVPFTIIEETTGGTWRAASQATNPFRPQQSEQPLWTTTMADSLNRVILVKSPDNAVATTSYLGNTVTVTDQAGKQRKSVTDALGRLTAVYEAPNSVNYQTNYTYDVLGNLRTVTQDQQTRSFIYDSLSRLISTTNPESGTISYSYDSGGNLLSKTDARSTTTAYSYDTLNRLQTRSYSGGTALATPSVSYSYDDASVPYGKGKLTAVSSSVSTSRYTGYDALGRIIASQQVSDGQTYQMSYTYDLAGNMLSETYPSGRVVRNSVDGTGRLSAISSRVSPNQSFKSYAQNISYTAHGAVSGMQLGNMRWESTTFNSRLQTTQIALGTSAQATNLLKLNYAYGTTNNNGNVQTQTITVPGMANPLVQSYTYDTLNRLQVANETGGSGANSWQQYYQHDRYGNRWFDAAGTSVPFPLNAVNNPTVSTATNRLNGYLYDAAGNITQDMENHTYGYDGENKLVSYDGGASYSYDGDGRRVKKVIGVVTTLFVYNAAGQMVAEYSINGQGTTTGTSYLTADNLGSPRIVTAADGSIRARHDYFPYGEELGAGVGGRAQTQGYSQFDGVRQRYTSKERDDETGLVFFGARHYSSVLGRFISVDPIKLTAERLLDPQRLNLYEYCRDNPLKYIDPDGEDLVLANAEARARFRQVVAPGLTRAERRNIKIVGNQVQLRNPNLRGSSPAYEYLTRVITNSNLTINYYAVAQGQTVTTATGVTVTYQDAAKLGGITTGEPGDRVRDVVVPVGGSTPVAALPVGSGNTTPNTEDAIFAHEVYGHGLDNDAIQVENEYRVNRNPPLPARSGEDHQYNTSIEAGQPELTQPETRLLDIQIPSRPLIPLLPLRPPQSPPRDH